MNGRGRMGLGSPSVMMMKDDYDSGDEFDGDKDDDDDNKDDMMMR